MKKRNYTPDGKKVNLKKIWGKNPSKMREIDSLDKQYIKKNQIVGIKAKR